MEGLGLPLGETARQIVCPRCRGGSSNEKSLSITRVDDGLLYKCHRASCGAAGKVFSSGVIAEHRETERKPEKKLGHPEPLTDINEEWLEYLCSKYGVDEELITNNRVMMCPQRNTVVFPCHDTEGRLANFVDRDYATGRKPKSINYPVTENTTGVIEPLTNPDGDSAVLVEDMMSAIKLSRLVPAIPLLGVHATYEQWNVIAAKYKNILIYLDADARWQAANLYSGCGILFDCVKVAWESSDPKDTRYERLEQVVQGFLEVCGSRSS